MRGSRALLTLASDEGRTAAGLKSHERLPDIFPDHEIRANNMTRPGSCAHIVEPGHGLRRNDVHADTAAGASSLASVCGRFGVLGLPDRFFATMPLPRAPPRAGAQRLRIGERQFVTMMHSRSIVDYNGALL